MEVRSIAVSLRYLDCCLSNRFPIPGAGFCWCRMRWISLLLGSPFLAVSLVFGASGQPVDVDAAIVFAVDVSSSISPALADLQRDGHAEAIRSPEVVAAITNQPHGCIAILYFEWSGQSEKKILIPWKRVCGASDANEVAIAIEQKGDAGSGRKVRGRTSISSAIDTAHLFLDQFAGHADRKIIDLSTNGTNNDGRPASVSRTLAVDSGLTINAILLKSEAESEEELFGYFEKNVIGGPSSFVTSAETSSDYVTKLRQKLLTEMSMPVLTGAFMVALFDATP